MKENIELVLVLPDIRSAENVGAIFRTADAAGVAKIYLTGYTSCPIDRFGRPQNAIAKTALGAEKSILWEHLSSTLELIETLKQDGYEIVGLEQDEKAIDYKTYECPKKVALVLGNEVAGIAKEILEACDTIIEIPMKGEKESLNVSVATGVALFKILGV